MASRLPSPQVAEAILKGADRTDRIHPRGPAKRPPAPRAVATDKPIATPPAPTRAVVQKPAVIATIPPIAAIAPIKPGASTKAVVTAQAIAVPVAVKQAPAAKAEAPVAAPPSPDAASHAGAPATIARGAESAPEAEAPKADAAAPAEKPTESKEEKGAKQPVGKEAKGPGAKGDEKGEADAEAEGGAAGVAVKLHMPEPPSAPSKATTRRIQGVKARAGRKSASHGALPAGAAQVGDARKAVTEPDAEANAKAQATLIAQVKAEPSQEIVELCERIRKVIREKRPPDEDALVAAKPDNEALNAGNQLNSTVEGETKKVQDNYGPVNAPPAPGAPAKGAELPPQPAAAGTAPINAKAATPDAVPDANVSLDKDAADAKKKQQDAGMDTPAAQEIKSGPIAEARGAQGELDQAAKEDPAKVLARQKEALGKAEGDMAALQAQALAALTESRDTTTKANASRQGGMVGSEEQMRTTAAAEAKKTFDDAKTQVNTLLQPLASTAMADWEAAKDLLVTNFKNDLAIVKKRVDDRHSGVGGFFTGLWDAVAGLPDWAEEAYTKAETNFGDGVIKKLTEVSTHVNSVIATCDLIIKNARERIAKIFGDLPQSLQTWAAQEQGKFDDQLDQLHKDVVSARDNFNKDLIERSSAAVDEVRAEIADLRKKAGGLVGRIVNAINRFIEDPIKFIIEGLLEILGIPPAAFWAVVAKIKKVVKDIADDPMKFANNLMKGLAQGFGQFFDNILSHLLKGFIGWLTGGLAGVGVQLPKDATPKSLITFFLQLMGITWPRIRKILVKHIGAKNVALIEKVYSLISLLIEKGPEGIYEMVKEKLSPEAIVDQIVQLAVDYMITAIIKAATARIIALFNPAGAIVQALEAIYRVLKWIFQNAAKIFTLVETVVNGIADILAGSIGGFANAVEKALAMLIAPVIGFIADYLGFGDLPNAIAKKIESFQEMVLGLIEQAIVWFVAKGKALLAALGLGKKDDKKGDGAEQVGEEVEFDADGEPHKLWIEVQGENAVVMVASTEERLDSFLKSKRVKDAVKKDKSGKLRGLVSQAEALLKDTDVDADAVVRELNSASKPEAGADAGAGAAASSKNNDVTKEEKKLAKVLAQIFQLVGTKGLLIEEVIGLPVDPLPEEAPEGYEYWKPPLPKLLREVKRASGYAAKDSKKYPRVSVDESGLVQTGAGPHRYDLDLVDRYESTISAAEAVRKLEGSTRWPMQTLKGLWEMETSATDARLRGFREQMEAVIAASSEGDLMGVEVQIEGGGRADYIVRIDKIQRLVEVKAWRTPDLSRGSDAWEEFLDQMSGYVDEAQTRGTVTARGAVKYCEVAMELRGLPDDLLPTARRLARQVIRNAARRRPMVKVIVIGIDV
ncbi:hypothetical protein LF41_3014 [Lysobacter dokdonensis DS-58]|uniref:Uncharacterized protein n=1 Tax=Lysobacter dokdonensis DS-58 TaxID=1300345 RepID=A0A0A2X293_9GAMM|nr:hypothetical protein [Lysobacter dokdonensis]KGQ19364.1 hypothetical protein LF41_3014 [Lysobacter dokdonensis DS-58]